jgi:hypothetical protein
MSNGNRNTLERAPTGIAPVRRFRTPELDKPAAIADTEAVGKTAS